MATQGDRELADPHRSYAVLVGAASYDHASLDELPAVANNLGRLAELFTDATIWGLPQGNCVRLPQPESREEVLDAIHDAARRAEDTLLVYFAGHGLAHPDVNGLLLALPGTDPERAYTALDFDAVRGEVLRTRRDVNRVVILDCCYGGRAFEGGMGGAGRAVQMAEQTRIAGSYLLTASSATRQSQSPPGETYTAFTGELIRLLESGLPDAGELIEATHVYEHLYGELRAKGRPLPQQRLSNTGRTLVFARNRNLAESAPVDDEEQGASPSGTPHVVTGPARTPRELVQEAARSRTADGGAAADALLREWAARRPVQEVAALAALLSAADDRAASGVVTAALSDRGPQAVADYLDALYAVDDEPADAARVLHHAAGQSVDVVAATYKSLRSNGRSAEADRLLSLRTERLSSTDDVLELAGALWSAGLEPEADRVLTAATTDSPEESGRLADALLAIGQQDRAFALYLRTQETVTRRPVPAFVQLLRKMHEAEHEDDAATILEGWIAGAVPPSASSVRPDLRTIAELCAELRSAGLGPDASTVLRRCAAAMSPADLTALAKTLYRQGRGEDSVLLLSMATRTGPVEAAVDFVDSLREMGRPVDANALLDEVGQSSAQDVARLLEGLEERGRTRDRDRLLSAIAAQPAPARLALLREPFLADGRYDEVFTSFGTASGEAFAEVLEQLRDIGSHLDLLALFDYGARRAPADLAARLAWLEHGGFPEALALRACLSDRGISAGGRVPTLYKSNLEAVADRFGSPTGLALALAALRALGREEAVRYAARRAAGAWFDSARRLELTLSLRRRGLHGTARVVIKGGSWDAIGHLRATVTGLHGAGFPDDAAYALRCYAVRLGGRAKKLAVSLGLEPPPGPAYFPLLRRSVLDDGDGTAS
ncbi:caspase family protein [Streptomyces sp. NBC_00669]|uniref:caspase, EACC1-associated type n=1 Tax=Streptomyces sp. NBC_00669 TaxID=2976011 RepID=UPI002E2F11EB|nr:caspase family protein [Streptomyces sp. NBC_00669]